MQDFTTTTHEEKLHPTLRATFVALPSDPAIPLTPEQLDSLFPGNRQQFIRSLVQLAARQTAESERAR